MTTVIVDSERSTFELVGRILTAFAEIGDDPLSLGAFKFGELVYSTTHFTRPKRWSDLIRKTLVVAGNLT